MYAAARDTPGRSGPPSHCGSSPATSRDRASWPEYGSLPVQQSRCRPPRWRTTPRAVDRPCGCRRPLQSSGSDDLIVPGRRRPPSPSPNPSMATCRRGCVWICPRCQHYVSTRCSGVLMFKVTGTASRVKENFMLAPWRGKESGAAELMAAHSCRIVIRRATPPLVSHAVQAAERSSIDFIGSIC